MELNGSALLAALRDTRPLDVVYREAGVSAEQFATARDAWLRRNARGELGRRVSHRRRLRRAWLVLDRGNVEKDRATTTLILPKA